MRFAIILLCMIPAMSFASFYNCEGAGFSIEINSSPLEMKISGNGLNTVAQNIRTSSTFDTIISGNSSMPAATFKIIIKDSSYGNPGDTFKAFLEISSATGVKQYSGIVCTRGNE